MKVLVPIPFDLTNLAHGRNLRIVHLLREMAGSCRITCLTPGPTWAQAVQNALPDVHVEAVNKELPAYYLPMPLGLNRAFSFLGYKPALLADVCHRAADYDAVLGFDLPSVIYLLGAVRAKSSTGSPRVVGDLIDDPWLLHQSLPRRHRWSPAGWKTAWSIARIRKLALPKLDALVAVSPLDARTLSAVSGRPVQVVPNGVRLPPTNSDTTEPLAVFTGAMDFPPNETAAVYLARQIWPLVMRQWQYASTHGKANGASSIRLAIVGANPTARVRALANIPGVTVTGYVDDMTAWLARARVAVAPMLSGSGIKNKVLEACAAGCPVVATSLGAAALPISETHGLSVEDQPDRFAARVHTLLTDENAARTAGLAAKDMVAQRFSWPRMATCLTTILAGEDRPEPETMTACSAKQTFLSPTALCEEALTHAAS
ncbi:MAG: glycosyltransferase [Phycisphaerales bacterium]|nr:glycosyltransferase [Phycisphaerales bacterium]